MDIQSEQSPGKPLKILVVGAGIAGLTVGLALRQQGHNVTILESSRFSSETGAAIHIAPNANGLLRRLGIFIEEFGANECTGFRLYAPTGHLIASDDFRAINKMWQHPWHLIHRAHLHTAIRERVVEVQENGPPCDLRLSSKVVSIDPNKAELRLDNGDVLSGDIILGADGVHSQCRRSLDGKAKIPFDAGHSAFRFLVPLSVLLEDPITQEIVGEPGRMTMVLAGEKRIVYYPCVSNTIMNCLLIHPSRESRSDGQDWNQPGDKQTMLRIAEPFSPKFKALLEKAPEDTLKVWTLLDMPVLQTWIKGNMALIGDAAHPFLPHLAQGGAQAIEDAASIAACLPLGTLPSEVPERLALYQECRQMRANRVQAFTRLSGKSVEEQKKGGYQPLEFNQYNFCHDEWEHSSQALQKHLWAKAPYRWRQSLSFGPSPGPRQPLNRLPHQVSYAGQHQIVHSIRFTTSRTYLQTLFPTTSFSFATQGTVVQASLICASLRNLVWLGGQGYNYCGLYLHGVRYITRSGDILHSTFLPILFENLIDPIITGRDELGAPKVGCDIDISDSTSSSGSYKSIKLSWRGTTFGEMLFEDLVHSGGSETDQVPPKPSPDTGLLMYRYIPAVGEPGKADAEYAIFEPYPETQPNGEGTSEKSGSAVNDRDPVQNGDTTHAATAELQSRVTEPAIIQGQSSSDPPLSADGRAKAIVDDSSRQIARKSSFRFDPGDWVTLPALHHIVSALAQIPVYEVLEADVRRVEGVHDISGAKRVVE